jgi:hypothetical protein
MVLPLCIQSAVIKNGGEKMWKISCLSHVRIMKHLFFTTVLFMKLSLNTSTIAMTPSTKWWQKSSNPTTTKSSVVRVRSSWSYAQQNKPILDFWWITVAQVPFILLYLWKKWHFSSFLYKDVLTFTYVNIYVAHRAKYMCGIQTRSHCSL